MNEWAEREIAFFGKITAGISHELKNVLAIIRESSGLMEDIMSISPEAVLSYQDKFKISLGKIQDQINRGVELTDRLNKFAHSSDIAITKVDLHKIIDQIVGLSQRFARLKNVVLSTYSPEPSVKQVIIETLPVQLQMALFTAIECCLNAMSAGGTIKLTIKENKEKHAVHFLCQGNLPEKSEFGHNLSTLENWPPLQALAASLKGSVETDESLPGIVLFLPDEISS